MEKPSTSLTEKDIDRLAKTLKRFFKNNVEDAKAEILKILATDPFVSPAEIHRQISKGNGNGKQHMSDAIEGENVATYSTKRKTNWRSLLREMRKKRPE